MRTVEGSSRPNSPSPVSTFPLDFARELLQIGLAVSFCGVRRITKNIKRLCGTLGPTLVDLQDPLLMFQTNPGTYLQLFGIQPLSNDPVIIVCVCAFIAPKTLHSLDVCVCGLATQAKLQRLVHISGLNQMQIQTPALERYKVVFLCTSDSFITIRNKHTLFPPPWMFCLSSCPPPPYVFSIPLQFFSPSGCVRCCSVGVVAQAGAKS